MKAYILFFICVSGQTIHLELVPDMTNVAFIYSFKRFQSRRAVTCEVIIETFRSNKVKLLMRSQLVKQKFILPASPWWGRLYECLVRLVKIKLKKTLGKALLRYRELETCICETKYVINSCHLIYISEDNLVDMLNPFHMTVKRNIFQRNTTRFEYIGNINHVKHYKHFLK